MSPEVYQKSWLPFRELAGLSRRSETTPRLRGRLASWNPSDPCHKILGLPGIYAAALWKLLNMYMFNSGPDPRDANKIDRK